MMLNFHFTNASTTLKQIENHLNTMTQGDLSKTLSQQSTSPVIKSITAMQLSLANILGTVIGASASMDISGEELGELAKNMRDTANLMAKQTAEIDSSTSEVEQNLASITDEAAQVSTAMENITTSAHDSAENLHSVTLSSDQMTSTITEIAENADRARVVANKASGVVMNATERVTTLGQAADEVKKVISVISDISDQTKLLALNATIEAARAGESGKGFAVVANEVKTLASQTSIATGEISQKVEAIHTATQATISEISSIEQVINDVNHVVTTIAGAVEEQSVTSQDISTNINNVATGITEMTDSVSDASKAISEISERINHSSNLAHTVSSLAHTMSVSSQTQKKDATKVYATSLEVTALGKDIEHVTSTINLPPSIKQQNTRKQGLITYTKAYSVNIDIIDSDHQKIMDFINTIHQAVKDDEPTVKIHKTLSALATFTVDHFAREEQYFEKYNYPDTISHKKMHTALLDTVANVIDQVEREEEVNFIEVLIFLKDWLQTHILKIDKKYSSFLNEHGIY